MDDKKVAIVKKTTLYPPENSKNKDYISIYLHEGDWWNIEEGSSKSYMLLTKKGYSFHDALNPICINMKKNQVDKYFEILNSQELTSRIKEEAQINQLKESLKNVSINFS